MERPVQLVLRRKDLTLLASEDEATATRSGYRQDTLDTDLEQRIARGAEPAATPPRMTETPSSTETTPAPVPVPHAPDPSETEEPEPPGAVTETPAQQASKKNTERPPRDFIVAYNSVFIGHFQSARWISTHAAFKIVARELQQGIEEPLDLSMLDLYKPTPLKLRKPHAIDGVGDGTFTWFSLDD